VVRPWGLAQAEAVARRVAPWFDLVKIGHELYAEAGPLAFERFHDEPEPFVMVVSIARVTKDAVRHPHAVGREHAIPQFEFGATKSQGARGWRRTPMMSSRPVGVMQTDPVSCPATCLADWRSWPVAVCRRTGSPLLSSSSTGRRAGWDRRRRRLVPRAQAPDALDELRGRTPYRPLGVPHRIPSRCAISSSPSAKRSR
jgi:hypothetical protein